MKIDAKAVWLDGVSITPALQGGLKRIDALTEPMRSRRSQLRDPQALHAYDFEVNEDANLTTVKSSFQTAAFAGWEHAQLRTRAGKLLLSARVPRPIDGRDAPSLAHAEAKGVLVLRRDETELWMNASIVERHRPQASQNGGLGLASTSKDQDPRVRVAACATDASEAAAAAWLETYCTAQAPCSPLAIVVDSELSAANFLKWASAFRGLCQRNGDPTCELGFRINNPPAPGEPPDRGGGAMRMGSTLVSGRLPPAVIQATVRSNYDRVRECYEQGLARDPKLRGKVVVRFVIGRDGKVGKALLKDDSTLPDAQVKACIQAVFPTLQFPPPDGGIVTVEYPMLLEPS